VDAHDLAILTVMLAARTARIIVDPVSLLMGLISGILGWGRVRWYAPAIAAATFSIGGTALVNSEREQIGLVPVYYLPSFAIYLVFAYTCYGIGCYLAKLRNTRAP
jgi:hypothetical protein